MIELLNDPAYFIYFGVWIFIFGLVFGSFLNCTAMRIVRGEDFVKGKSRCRSCGHELGARDLIPLFSWLLSGGKCRYCKAKVSARYPLTEFVFAMLMVGLYLRYGIGGRFVAYAGLTGALFVLSLVDLESFEIPDGCLLAGLAFFAVDAVAQIGDIKEIAFHLAAGIVFGGSLLVLSLVMDRVLGRESLGGGDIKLFALTGLYFGFIRTMLLVIISCFIGLGFAAVYKKNHDSEGGAFPFGPSIAIAAYVIMLFGDRMAAWYMRTWF